MLDVTLDVRILQQFRHCHGGSMTDGTFGDFHCGNQIHTASTDDTQTHRKSRQLTFRFGHKLLRRNASHTNDRRPAGRAQAHRGAQLLRRRTIDQRDDQRRILIDELGALRIVFLRQRVANALDRVLDLLLRRFVLQLPFKLRHHRFAQHADRVVAASRLVHVRHVGQIGLGVQVRRRQRQRQLRGGGKAQLNAEHALAELAADLLRRELGHDQIDNAVAVLVDQLVAFVRQLGHFGARVLQRFLELGARFLVRDALLHLLDQLDAQQTVGRAAVVEGDRLDQVAVERDVGDFVGYCGGTLASWLERRALTANYGNI